MFPCENKKRAVQIRCANNRKQKRETNGENGKKRGMRFLVRKEEMWGVNRVEFKGLKTDLRVCN
jgi:hypothetical protein